MFESLPHRRATYGKPPAGRAITRDDSLFRLIGIAESGIAGGVSEHKHEYVARVYRRLPIFGDSGGQESDHALWQGKSQGDT
jgi:hypothetical protein